MKPILSVIVPVYNVEKYLPRCLDSLVNQTLKNMEIIVINDGTKDNSQQIIDDYASRYPQIRPFKKPNGGIAETRNFGLAQVQGEYFGFLDSDDFTELDMFEKIGITCEEMRDKDSRKLIFTNEELKLKFFLAKGPDVPTYVEYGAADIGIVGKDTILEEGRKLYEVMDLGFGACRMCVCGPESAREVLNNNQLIRVATKYPNIAKDYFYNKKHQTVEIIKLNGSIELAPIVGLSEVIVDIVETGSTLRENGLKVLEEVCPLSARMVVNQVSMKMEDERIRKLITELRGVIK